MQIFVLTLIRNCLEPPFLASIRASLLELPQCLLLLYVHSLLIYVHGCEGFFCTYLIKQCDTLLFMNLFCWEWNKSSLCKKRNSRDEKKAKPRFWEFPKCFRSVYSKNIYWLLSRLERIPGKEGEKIKIWDLAISLCIKNL